MEAVSTEERAGAESAGKAEKDPIQTYLEEIGRIPLVNATLEVGIAQRIEVGNEAAARIAAHELAAAGQGSSKDLLNADGLRGNRRLMRQGLKAKDRLIEANLHLVVPIARRELNRGLSLLDLIQEGNLGLMRSVDTFDHAKGIEFSTYATHWIREAIASAIADQARVRIPGHMVETIIKVVLAQRQLLEELGREPTVEELADRVDLPVERVGEILRIKPDVISSAQPIGDWDTLSWEINGDDPENPEGGSRVREPRRPRPSSGSGGVELSIE